MGKMSGQPVYDEASILDLDQSSKLCAHLVRAVFEVGCVVCRHLLNSAPARDEFLAHVRAEWNDAAADDTASMSRVESDFYDDRCAPVTGKDKRFFKVILYELLRIPGRRKDWGITEHFTVTTRELLRCRGHSNTLPPGSQLISSLQLTLRQASSSAPGLIPRNSLDSSTGAYITLSHRWTTPEPPKLRLENEAELLSPGISIVSLPQTFQDDSVEEPSDWEREAGLMGAIYGGSLLNVAALDADGLSQTGFLARLAEPSTETLLPVFCSRDNALPQSLREDEIISGGDLPEGSVIHSHGAFDHQVFHSMLLGRGWVHQEILPAPATLFVSQKQAWWHCTGGTSSEAYPDSIPPFLELPDTAKLRSVVVKAPDKAAAAAANSSSDKTEEETESSNPERHRRQTLIVWCKVVQMYSSADFTYLPDRLVALAGVVDALADILGDYYCGMWYKLLPMRGSRGRDGDEAQRDDFLSQLMWMHSPKMPLRREALAFGDTQQQQPAVDGSRDGESLTKTPIIPTRSWASCPRAIAYFPGENGPRTLTHLASRPPFERLNPFGWPMDHAAATLHLLGALIPFCMLNSPLNLMLGSYPRVSDGNKDLVHIYFDYRHELDAAEEMAAGLKFAHPLPGFYFLPLYYSEQRELRIEGVILRERSDHQLLGCPAGRRLFSRVGHFRREKRRPGEARKWRVEDMPEDWPPIFEDFKIARYRNAGLDKADLCEDRELGGEHVELEEIYLI
ncbi:hypothetical protein MAPG_00186 [Magnaporthiopsis poae ATCC 64411]|uniref:Heterokaryon incompatibility domain-containing protein n=1 Tax=Magnaporthiopsis poae (strain ATCC 64411 / 73-15) TaxID=644358 RepID=A0A0C4DKB8_MAGP6|nr:hypothetical protein MAPG_00186 [Magnaporthiopsis poae ATCC 64411]